MDAESVRFHLPMTMVVAGSTSTGKSTVVAEILKQREQVLDQPLNGRVLYCYGIFDPKYAELQREIPQLELHEGFPADMLRQPLDHFDPTLQNLIVLDDLQMQASADFAKLFCVTAHHANLSCILVLQNLFSDNQHIRAAVRNSFYLILTSALRNKQSISTIARQAFPKNPNYLVDAYEQTMKDQHSWLLVDFHPKTSKQLCVRSGLLPDNMTVYLPR